MYPYIQWPERGVNTGRGGYGYGYGYEEPEVQVESTRREGGVTVKGGGGQLSWVRMDRHSGGRIILRYHRGISKEGGSVRRQERGLGDARATRKEGEVWLSLIRAGPSRVTNVWGPSILRRGEGSGDGEWRWRMGWRGEWWSGGGAKLLGVVC